VKSFFKTLITHLLTLEARMVLRKHKPVIIGITGSVGKTSTKDAIAAVVGNNYRVRASKKSFNSEFGIPLTILDEDTAWTNVFGWLRILFSGLITALFSRDYPEVLVLEIGVDHPGDMARAMAWVSLDIAVVTYIGERPVHMEAFGSAEKLLEEKMLIRTGLKSDGALILIQDDPKVLSYATTFPGRVTTFGFNDGATVRSERYAIRYDAYGAPIGIEAHILIGSSSFSVVYDGIIGRQFVYPLLAACAVAGACGIEVGNAVHVFEQSTPESGRMRLLQGTRGTLLVDDTYNASPVATIEALNALVDLRVRGKKVAVLADMKELGHVSKEAHHDIGTHAASIVDLLVTIGPESKEMALAAKSAGLTDIVSFDTAAEAAPYVREHIADGDVVLCKGSQSMRVEHVVRSLLANPRDVKLLVRQGTAWTRR
jgi:UDP-N-acetylmuramoyl-tripeptide--D-alanyl-D-alanine ligase